MRRNPDDESAVALLIHRAIAAVVAKHQAQGISTDA
jgi:ribulose 1,5-bisphosphate carboxylase large subunit-like protein